MRVPTVQALLDSLANILDVEKVNPTDELKSFSEWDSLGVLSTIASIESDYGINLTAVEVRAAPTPEALFAVVSQKKAKAS